MGKEFKIGVAVVGTVAIAFCTILYQRVNKLKTTAAVAKEEPASTGAPSKVDKLFATSQLDTASGDVTATAADAGFQWNAREREAPASEPAAEHVAVEAAPPRASFLPKEEPAADDRYGSRYADVKPSALAEGTTTEVTSVEATPADAAPVEATPIAAAPFGRIVADMPDVPTPAEASTPTDAPAQPSAVSNPFARTLPGTTDTLATGPTATEPATGELAVTGPAETEPPAAAPNFEDSAAEPATMGPNAALQPTLATDPAAGQPGTGRITIAQPSEQPRSSEPAELSIPAEPTAPARLDPRTIPTAAIGESPRPASRFISPEEETPPTAAGSRFTDTYTEPAPRTALPSNTDADNSIVGGTYRLGPNENFWSVSERAYGTGGYFKSLAAYNAEQHPIADDLAVGDEIRVPERAELERLFPDLCPKPGRRSTRDSFAIQASARLQATGKTYVVQEGDTLFDIARYELGKAARWAELYELNRNSIGNDIDFLRPGMELILPGGDDRADSLTREPGGTLR